MIQRILAVWSLVPLPFQIQLVHLEVLGHVLLKPIGKDFEHYLASMWNECNCAVVWTCNAMVFPVVLYGCESWTIKKAESWRIDAFELWGWRKLLRVPWTARRSNQSVLKEISPEYSLEGLMLRVKFQYFGTWWEEPTHWKGPWC